MVHVPIFLTASVCLLSTASAFSTSPSSFTGRASAVASRAEFTTTDLSCPPSRQHDYFRKGDTSLGIFGKKKEEETVAVEETEDEPENENMMSQIKSAGAAGAVSLFIWELAFWAISIPVAIFGFVSVAGSWPDLTDKEDLAKVGAEAFAFANVARLALPVRIGLAVSTTPWVKENIVEAPWAQKIKNVGVSR